MIIDCISDLHGFYPELEGGDLLIIAGDLTATDDEYEVFEFFKWLHDQPYNKKILITGNHDNIIEKDNENFKELNNPKSNLTNIEYLCDSGTEFEGLKIWGSPWTNTFEGMNPKCKAFTLDTEEKLAVKFSLIPEDIDILVTHSPPHGILDSVNRNEFCGSESLRNITLDGQKFKRKKLHVFGHIHEHGGKMTDFASCKFVNASLVNEHYQPVNKPIRVIL